MGIGEKIVEGVLEGGDEVGGRFEDVEVDECRLELYC